MEPKKLTRSANKMLAGVCGGIAEYFDVDPTLIRVVYVLLSLFTAAFPGLLVYIILLILMPQPE
ncbi:MAG: PspC domain-containing protein [Paludibacteraceae bacterium]|jgi:Putative stress-responsive transcriptional regulator|nr:PspC domain-containing protein [Paludibacteraceae bacterium]